VIIFVIFIRNNTAAGLFRRGWRKWLWPLDSSVYPKSIARDYLDKYLTASRHVS